MRHGVFVDIRHPHEAAHLAPLRQRLQDVRAGDESVASVILSADTRLPVQHAYNIQIFHGLGDKGYTLNPIFLQKRRFPRTRTAFNMALRSMHLPAPFLRPSRRPGNRRSRYQQVNAYGPRFHDRLQEMLKDAEVSKFGHVALNELAHVAPHAPGPLLWMPTWDNRAYLGGKQQSSLAPFAHEVALVSRHVPVRIKYHPLTLEHDQNAEARAELEKEPGISIAPLDADPYASMRGVRGILTDTSSLGFEAYCMGMPVALAKPLGVRYQGLHEELAQRVHVLQSGKPDLLQWAEDPIIGGDTAWSNDLLYPPQRTRNDAFAAEIRQHLRH